MEASQWGLLCDSSATTEQKNTTSISCGVLKRERILKNGFKHISTCIKKTSPIPQQDNGSEWNK